MQVETRGDCGSAGNLFLHDNDDDDDGFSVGCLLELKVVLVDASI